MAPSLGLYKFKTNFTMNISWRSYSNLLEVSVDFSSVADLDNQDDELLIFDWVDDTVVTVTNTIVGWAFRTFQFDGAIRPWIVCKGVDLFFNFIQ